MFVVTPNMLNDEVTKVEGSEGALHKPTSWSFLVNWAGDLILQSTAVYSTSI